MRQVADVVHDYGGRLAYDGSHTLGLIAGGRFQDPLAEGADVLLGSTHTTFPGPQGGIILTNDDEIARRVELLVDFQPFRGQTLVCNPHLARIAATGIVLQETDWERYARQVVANAQRLAEVLACEGVPLRGARVVDGPRLTSCHQVVTAFDHADATRLRDHLARHLVNTDALLRFGTAEITRLGFTEDTTEELGWILAHLINRELDVDPQVDRAIEKLIAAHPTVVL